MAHKHTRSRHKRIYPTWHPDQRVIGMGRRPVGDPPHLEQSPQARSTMRMLHEVERRVRAAEDAG